MLPFRSSYQAGSWAFNNALGPVGVICECDFYAQCHDGIYRLWRLPARIEIVPAAAFVAYPEDVCVTPQKLIEGQLPH